MSKPHSESNLSTKKFDQERAKFPIKLVSEVHNPIPSIIQLRSRAADRNRRSKMPARNFDCYLQEARNNFDAVRPAPIPTDGNILMGQSQHIHISTNCYYGFHGTKNAANVNQSTDCEMMEVGDARETPSTKQTAKKRSAVDAECTQTKRLRLEVQRENIVPETNETIKLETNTEDLLESLYWNIHGGSVFHLTQCP